MAWALALTVVLSPWDSLELTACVVLVEYLTVDCGKLDCGCRTRLRLQNLAAVAEGVVTAVFMVAAVVVVAAIVIVAAVVVVAAIFVVADVVVVGT